MHALKADGWQVRALVRRDTDLEAETVRGDLADDAALRRLAEGADVLIHNAGLVKARTRAGFFAVNADGARRVAEAALQVPHVVLVSSLVAREPHLSHYAASKRAGEAVMAEVLGRRLSIVRPPAIYGPGDRELLPVFRAARSSPVLPLLAPGARIAMIHVADAARQIAAVAAAGPGLSTALSDDRPQGYDWRELMSAVAAAVGRNPRIVPAPRIAARCIGLANDLAALLGATPMLTSAKARELLHPDWSVRPEERWAGLPPVQYPLDAGFSDTVAWYRSAAWMKQ